MKNIRPALSDLFWLFLGVYIAIHAYRLGLGHFSEPGPGLIFFLAALLLIGLSVVDIAAAFIGSPQKDKAVEEGPLWKGLRWKKVLLLLAGLSAYAFFLDAAGFVLSTFLLMVFLYKAVEPTKWWGAIAGALITGFFSYVVFKIWLEVPFPKGVLGF